MSMRREAIAERDAWITKVIAGKKLDKSNNIVKKRNQLHMTEATLRELMQWAWTAGEVQRNGHFERALKEWP